MLLRLRDFAGLLRRRPFIGPLLLAVSALSLRLLYLAQVADSPLFTHPIVDARTYVHTALSLAQGHWAGDPEPFWQPPLFPYLLGVIFYLFGESYYLPRVLQAVAGTAVCLLVGSLGRRAFSPRIGWVAAAAAALYGPFLYFEGELLPASLAVFLDGLILLALARAPGAGTRAWLIAGLLLGLSVLMVPSVLLFVPAALLWTYRQAPVPSRGPAMAALLFGVALVIAPVTLRNRLVGEEWVLISYNSGINFYIGNNPDYDRTTNIRPGRDWQELTDMPEREAGITGKQAGSQFFFSRSWDYLTSDPAGYAFLQLRKLYLFWRGNEIPRNLDPYFARRHSYLLQGLLWIRGLAFPFGIASPLALAGLFLYLRSPRDRTPTGDLLFLFAVAYTISVVLFFVTDRYRLPVVPPLLLFASYTVARLRLLRGRRLAAALVPLGGLTVALNAGAPAHAGHGDAQEHVYLGQAYGAEEMPARALQQYELALEKEPDHEIALMDMGTVLMRLGNQRRALATWERLLELYPDRSDARFVVADMHFQAGDHALAARHYEHLIEEKPDWSVTQARLAQCLSHAGNLEGAAAAYRRALELDPEALPLYRQLAALEIHRGDATAALVQVRALEERARDGETLRAVGALYRQLGMAQEADAAFERASRLE